MRSGHGKQGFELSVLICTQTKQGKPHIILFPSFYPQQRLYSMSSAMETDNHEALLGALQQVRFISATAKVDATVEIVKRTLETEPAGKPWTIRSTELGYPMFFSSTSSTHLSPDQYLTSRHLHDFRQSGQICSSKARKRWLGR